MRKKEGILHRLAFAADLLEEPMPGDSLIEIIGTHRVLIENHRGVFAYSDTLVKIKVKKGSVGIQGNSLVLSRMTKGQLVVSGYISTIEFCKE